MKINTVTKVAFYNMKYYKSRNFFIGLAILLTTMLLFTVPTVGKGMIDLQFAAVNQLYPSWHALYRDVNEATIQQLIAHHDISHYGLRSDVGRMTLNDATVSMLYIDSEGLKLYHTALEKGTLPKAENEIAVSDGILEALGQSGELGDSIDVPYQILRNGTLDFTETKKFRICGFLKDSISSKKQKTYTALISEAFLKKELSAQQITYRFLFQINDAQNPTKEQIEEKIKTIAGQFQIKETDIAINNDYLMANYVDPAFQSAIILIMAIIVIAGVITIYSIYYVSMNQKIQEFGRLKTLGATSRQIKQMILREGLCIAALAIPLGLILGTLMVNLAMNFLYQFSSDDIVFIETVRNFLDHGIKAPLYWWIYILAASVSLCTVYISLMRPMHVAAKISEIEALRTQGTSKKTRNSKKGYLSLTVSRLTCRYLTENKRKSLLTILSMSATGIFFMIVATILSCADPSEGANNSIIGSYELSPITEENNKEHPELKWSEIQKNHPLSETLKKQLESLEGVTRIDVFSNVRVSGGPFEEDDRNDINGVPQEYASILEKGIKQGGITYEDLKAGDKVIIDKVLLHWYPDLTVGNRLLLTVYDGDDTYQKEFEIAAIGSYEYGLTNGAYLIMAKEAADRLCKNSCDAFFHIIADQKYDKNLEKSLQTITEQSGRIELRTWKQEYDTLKSAIRAIRGASYAFLGILAVISVLNLMNTMINNVHVRKKEIGILQAVGMSDSQLMKMLQLEGLFYTACTLLLSVGFGSIAGYPVFLYAKANGMFNITNYHYPALAAAIVSASLITIQVLLAAGIAKSVRKESLIDRIQSNSV